jgi:DNA topoisomerase-1
MRRRCSVLRDREYVRLDQKRLVPEDKGRLVTAFLESFFQRYVQYDFTAEPRREARQDFRRRSLIGSRCCGFLAGIHRSHRRDARNCASPMSLMRSTKCLVQHLPAKGRRLRTRAAAPQCGAGRFSLKTGKFGAFIGCSNYPECRYTRQFSETGDDAAAAISRKASCLGDDPETGEPVTLRSGRFGPYVQLGEADDKEKPKRSSIPKGIDIERVDLEKALQLLSLPRPVGEHPETNKTIEAGLGRYGPYLLHDGKYTRLDSIEDVFEIGINRAVTVIAEKAAAGGRGRFGAAKAEVLKDLGEHPDGGGKIEVLSGRYGPYVKHGKINATLPKGGEPADLTVDEAVKLIEERAAKSGKKPAKKKAAASSKTAKPAAKKKPAAKSSTTKAKAKSAQTTKAK